MTEQPTIPVRFPGGQVIQCEVDDKGYVVVPDLGSFHLVDMLIGEGVSASEAQKAVDRLREGP